MQCPSQVSSPQNSHFYPVPAEKIKPKEISPASCPLFCNPETALTVCLVRFHVFPPVYHQFCQTQQLWHSEFSATSSSSLFIYYSKDWLPSAFRSSTSPLQVHKENTTTIIIKTRPPNHADSTALGLFFGRYHLTLPSCSTRCQKPCWAVSGASCFTAAAGRCSGAEGGWQSWWLLEDELSPGKPRGLRFQPPQTPTCLVQASPCLDVYEGSPPCLLNSSERGVWTSWHCGVVKGFITVYAP